MRGMESLRLCLVHVHAPLVEALRQQGHQVLALRPEEGVVLHLPRELERHSFTPDIVIQQELLAPRTLLAGLEDIRAARVFWALDPHLNAFWQAPYARLFDLVFSTQARNIPDLEAQGAGPVLHLPWFSQDFPFTPHEGRPRLAGFVGRLGPARPVRQWLVELMASLLPGRFEAVADIPFTDMLEFTRQTRLIPNESIAGEVNFRLFEAAGLGCLVLAQDLGPEQAALFEPGREVMVCADALELAETLRLLAARPKLAEAMGRAAWERVQAEHLPRHRAARMVEQALAAPRRAYGAAGARRWLSLALAGLFESGRMQSGGEALARDLAALPGAQDGAQPDAQAGLLAAQLRVVHALDDKAAQDRALERCEALELAGGADLALRLACSMLHLRRALENPGGAGEDMARTRLWATRAGVENAAPEPGAGPVPLLLAWAARAQASGLPARGGFAFDPARHLPACASECLFLARSLEPASLEVLDALAAHLRHAWGAEVLLLGALSELGLRRPGDWRTGLELGLCDLRVFRPEAGLAELALAQRQADEQGQGQAFAAGLAAAAPSGRVRRALSGGEPPGGS